MDATSKTHRSGSSRSYGIMGAAFLFLDVIPVDWSVAAPPPAIHASGKPQGLHVLDTSQPGVFPEQSWKIVAPNPLGPTVAVWTVTPFTNAKDPKSYVDAQLNLRTVIRGNSGGWQVLVPQARTAVTRGTSMASVAAASQGGNGEVGITVSFLGHEQPIVTDGVYETTVVGTITEAF